MLRQLWEAFTFRSTWKYRIRFDNRVSMWNIEINEGGSSTWVVVGKRVPEIENEPRAVAFDSYYEAKDFVRRIGLDVAYEETAYSGVVRAAMLTDTATATLSTIDGAGSSDSAPTVAGFPNTSNIRSLPKN